MPGLTFPQCFDPTTIIAHAYGDQVFKVLNDEEFHFDHCDSVNLYQDGFWRWFFSSIHCKCECHTIGMTKEYIRFIEKRARNRLIFLFGMPILLIIIAAT